MKIDGVSGELGVQVAGLNGVTGVRGPGCCEN